MITPSFGFTATERVLPSMALDFTTANLDSRVTFTRSGGTATYTDSNGYVASAGVDVPRFDYDPVTLACKGLLIEEARTNLFTYSSDYTNTWVLTKLTDFGTTTSPDNTNTGYKLVPNTESSTHYITQTLALTSGTTYTFSVYAKAAEKTNLQLRIGTTNDIQITFNVDTGTITSTVAGTGTITDVGNGWYRCTATATCTSTASLPVRIYVAEGNNTTLTFAGNDSDGLYIWGAQLEVGAFATSYIPTTTTALTRNADVATMTGTNFSNWFNASEGCISGTALGKSPIATDGPIAYLANTSLSLRFIWITRRQTTIGGVYNGTLQASLSDGTAVTVDDTVTPTLSYQVNNIQGARNGHTPVSDLSATLPTCDTLFLGVNSAQDTFLNGWLKKINYYPQWLSAANVQAISKAT